MTDTDRPVVELHEILARSRPPERVHLALDAIEIDKLGVGDLLDVSEACGISPDDLGAALRAGTVLLKSQIIVALAWVIRRRVDPTLTLADAKTWHVTASTAEPDPTPPGPREHARGSGSGSPARRASRPRRSTP